MLNQISFEVFHDERVTLSSLVVCEKDIWVRQQHTYQQKDVCNLYKQFLFHYKNFRNVLVSYCNISRGWPLTGIKIQYEVGQCDIRIANSISKEAWTVYCSGRACRKLLALLYCHNVWKFRNKRDKIYLVHSNGAIYTYRVIYSLRIL